MAIRMLRDNNRTPTQLGLLELIVATPTPYLGIRVHRNASCGQRSDTARLQSSNVQLKAQQLRHFSKPGLASSARHYLVSVTNTHWFDHGYAPTQQIGSSN